MKLNIGCGTVKREGYINVDSNPAVNPDITATVPPIPAESSSVDHIYASHFLEHLTNEAAAEFMAEAWRVLKVGKTVEIIVPYVLSHDGWQDPTHKSFWVWERALYFTNHMRHLKYGYESRFIIKEPGITQNSNEIRFTLIKTAEQEPCNCFDCKRGYTNAENRKRLQEV